MYRYYLIHLVAYFVHYLFALDGVGFVPRIELAREINCILNSHVPSIICIELNIFLKRCT